MGGKERESWGGGGGVGDDKTSVVDFEGRQIRVADRSPTNPVVHGEYISTINYLHGCQILVCSNRWSVGQNESAFLL